MKCMYVVSWIQFPKWIRRAGTLKSFRSFPCSLVNSFVINMCTYSNRIEYNQSIFWLSTGSWLIWAEWSKLCWMISPRLPLSKHDLLNCLCRNIFLLDTWIFSHILAYINIMSSIISITCAFLFFRRSVILDGSLCQNIPHMPNTLIRKRSAQLNSLSAPYLKQCKIYLTHKTDQVYGMLLGETNQE